MEEKILQQLSGPKLQMAGIRLLTPNILEAMETHPNLFMVNFDGVESSEFFADWIAKTRIPYLYSLPPKERIAKAVYANPRIKAASFKAGSVEESMIQLAKFHPGCIYMTSIDTVLNGIRKKREMVEDGFILLLWSEVLPVGLFRDHIYPALKTS